MRLAATVAVLALMIPLSSAGIAQHGTSAIPPPPPERTIVHDGAALERLRNNGGITLQWISWDYRGHVSVSDRGEVVHLSGVQHDRDSLAFVQVTGDVVEIGSDYFILNGHIIIRDTPDVNRYCERDGLMRFAITQNRRYWRYRDFGWCTDLTDYIDIYF